MIPSDARVQKYPLVEDTVTGGRPGKLVSFHSVADRVVKNRSGGIRRLMCPTKNSSVAFSSRVRSR